MAWPSWAPPSPPRPRSGGSPSRKLLRSKSLSLAPSEDVLEDALKVGTTESLTAICLLIIATCALGFMMFVLRAILIPFAFAVVLMYLLQPMVNYLCKPPRRWCDKCANKRGEVCFEGCFRVTKSRTYSAVVSAEEAEQNLQHPAPKAICWGCFEKPLIPRWIAVILAIMLVLTALIAVGAILYGSMLNLQANFGKYEIGAERLATLIDRWLQTYHYSIDDDFLPYAIQKVRSQVPRTLKTLLSSLQYSFLVAIFLVYLLISPVKPIKSSVWGIIDLHIRRYIRLKSMVGMLVATVVTSTLWLLGVDMVYVFGIATFALHFIPNLGPLIATFLPMPLVIFDPDLSYLSQVLAFVLPTMVHMVAGNFIEPGLFGEQFELSPVVVLLSLAFWGYLWGIPGMILAVPMVVIARIVCDHLDHPYAKTLMRLLEGNVFEAREDSTLIPNWDQRPAGVGIGGCGLDTPTSTRANLSWSDDIPVDNELKEAEIGAKRSHENPRRYGSTGGP